jgi:hypothetical protein
MLNIYCCLFGCARDRASSVLFSKIESLCTLGVHAPEAVWLLAASNRDRLAREPPTERVSGKCGNYEKKEKNGLDGPTIFVNLCRRRLLKI